MRRVVVTGLGLVTPLACGVEESWAALLAGKSGASRITKFKTDDLATKIACQVPRGDGAAGTFNPDHWVDPKEQGAWMISSSLAWPPPSRRWWIPAGSPRPRKSAAAPGC